MSLIYVFIGGGIGASLRYAATMLFGAFWRGEFPLSTFAINVLGSFLIGFLAQNVSRETFLYQLLIVGVLGGFTTFSAFSLEVVRLFQAEKPAIALAYIGASVVISAAAAYLGYILAK